MKFLSTLIAGALASSFFSNSRKSILGRGEPSDVQKRMRTAWIDDAPRRNRLAAECSEWNSKVMRRNQKFVRRQLARGRVAQ